MLFYVLGHVISFKLATEKDTNAHNYYLLVTILGLFQEVSMQDNFRQSVQQLQLKPDFEDCKLVGRQLSLGSVHLCHVLIFIYIIYDELFFYLILASVGSPYTKKIASVKYIVNKSC